MNRDKSTARQYEEETLHDASEADLLDSTTQATKKNSKSNQLSSSSAKITRVSSWVAYLIVFIVVLVSSYLLFQRVVQHKQDVPQTAQKTNNAITHEVSQEPNPDTSSLLVPKQETLRLWYGLGSEHAKSFKFGSPEMPNTALFYLALMQEQDATHVLTQRLSQDISEAFLRFAKLKRAYGDEEGYKQYQLLAKQYESRALLKRNQTKVKVSTKYYLANGEEIPRSVITDLYEQLVEAAHVWNLEPESKRGTALDVLKRMRDINPGHELIPRAEQQIAHAYYALYKLAQSNGDAEKEALYLSKVKQHYVGQP